MRSSVHPVLFAKVYQIADGIGSFTNSASVRSKILIAAPKIAQAIGAALTDFFTYRLSQRVYGTESRASRAALALTILSPWNWFCSTRTLSNSLETTLTAIALYFWPWDWFISAENTEPIRESGTKRSVPSAQHTRSPTNSGPNASLTFAAYACILRPTNGLIWITLSIASLWPFRSITRSETLARNAVFTGCAILLMTASIDVNFYGQWVLPPLRFLYFNVVQSLAVFYGRNRHDYYFTEGIYLLLTTATPYAAIGMLQALSGRSNHTEESVKENRIRRLLALPVVTSLVVFSLISHKEVRFIYPLLPMLHVLAAKPLAAFFDPFPVPRKTYRLAILILGVSLNLFVAYYTGYVHQRGVIDVMHYLRHEQENILQPTESASKNITVGFLMPCHSTPWRSHLVYSQIKAWALTCEPPLHLSIEERKSYLDEADVFYNDPGLWLNRNMESSDDFAPPDYVMEHNFSRRAWSDYVVFFEQLEPTMQKVTSTNNYRQCWRGFNTHWHDDWRRQGDVVVWCKRWSR